MAQLEVSGVRNVVVGAKEGGWVVACVVVEGLFENGIKKRFFSVKFGYIIILYNFALKLEV